MAVAASPRSALRPERQLITRWNRAGGGVGRRSSRGANISRVPRTVAAETGRVQILSTNDLYQPDGQTLLDQGSVAFAFEGNLLESSDPVLREALDLAWEGLPGNFPEAFLPVNLCSGNVTEEARRACLDAAPKLRLGTNLLTSDLEREAFPGSSGHLWQEGHLGCFSTLQTFRAALENPRTKFGNLIDLMMTFEASRHRFEADLPAGRSFSVMPGDYLGPSLMSTLLGREGKYGQHVIDSFNHIGMDYVVLGNHELDPGDPTIRLADSAFTVLTANVRTQSDQMLHHTRHLDYKVDRLGDARICWFGVTSDPDAAAAARKMPGKLRFWDFRSAAIDVQKMLKGTEDCTVTIALTHLRVAQDLQLYRDSMNCAKQGACYHLDAILGGHDHSVAMFNLMNPWNGKATHFWKMGQNGQFVIDLQIDLADRAKSRISLVPVVEGACSQPPPDLSASAGDLWETRRTALTRIMTEHEADIGIHDFKAHVSDLWFEGRWDTQHLRLFETRAGNLLADVLRFAQGGSDVVVMKAGDVRGQNFLMRDQPLTEFDFKTELPFNDVLVRLETPLLLLVGVVFEALQERRQPTSSLRFIVSGLEVVFKPEQGNPRDVLAWAKKGKPQGRPFFAIPASRAPLLALEVLTWHGDLHAAGSRVGATGSQLQTALSEKCPEPPCTVVEGMALQFDADLPVVFTTTDFAALRAGLDTESVIIRLMGELARWETHCARGAPNLTTIGGQGFACHEGLPSEGFYGYLEEVLKTKNALVYAAMKDLRRRRPLFWRPASQGRHRRMLLGRPQADRDSEGVLPLAVASDSEGDGTKKVLPTDACMEGAALHGVGVRSGAADLLPGAGLLRKKLAQIRHLPYPRWRSLPVNFALRGDASCGTEEGMRSEWCEEVLLAICMESGPRPPGQDIDGAGDMVQLDPVQLAECEGFAQRHPQEM